MDVSNFMVIMTSLIIIITITLIIRSFFKIAKNPLLSKNERLLWYLIIFSLPILGSAVVLLFMKNKLI